MNRYLAYIEQPLKNRGDESAHRGIIRRLNLLFPKLNILIIFLGGSNSDIKEFIVDNPMNHYIQIPQRKGTHWALLKGLKCSIFWKLHPSIRKFISYLKKCDVIMCSPGGVNMGGFQNYEHLAFLDIATKTGKPVIYYGRSIGPFSENTQNDINFKCKSIELLKKFAYLSVRDSKSAEEMDALELSFSQTTDCAFLDPIDHSNSSIKELSLPEKYAVIVPNNLIWHYAFKQCDLSIIRQFYSRLIKRLMEKYPEIGFVMIPQTYNEATYLRKDYNFFKEIENIINSPRIRVIDETYSSDIQQSIISKAQFIIGARYHSIVFAINQAVPFVALSYEHKIEGLLSILNLKSRMINISSKDFADAESTNNLIESCLDRLNLQQDSISQAREVATSIALNKITELKKFFLA